MAEDSLHFMWSLVGAGEGTNEQQKLKGRMGSS